MGLPAEHTALIQRTGFPIPDDAMLQAQERELLTRYGYWLEALANYTLVPVTTEQKRFVQVAHGEVEAQSAFEIAWVKCRQATPLAQQAVGPLEVADRLSRLDKARKTANTIQDEYKAWRIAILEQVRSQLEELDAEYADRFEATSDEASRLEREARQAVLAHGASFKHGSVHAVYARGSVTWDGKGLSQYLETNPDIGKFRRVGSPSVRLRYQASEEPAALPSAEDAEMEK